MGELYDMLCDECNVIDLKSAFSSTTTINDERGIHIANLGSRLRSIKDCALCRLFASVRVCPEFQLGHELRAFSFLQSYGEVQAAQWNAKEEKAELDFVVLGVVPMLDELTEEQSSKVLKRCSSHGFVAQIGPSLDDRRMFHPTIVTDQVDIASLKGWVDYCRMNHTQACSGTNDLTALLPGIKVIDCGSGAVVPLTAGVPFASLSYVVGNCPIAPPVPNAGVERYPILIRDAIALTMKLGVNSLWVDQFCINQLDPAERAAQIRSMNLIYSAADFTIIAAAGNDPYTGLPGVGNTERHPQLCAQTPSGTLVSTLPHPTREIQLLKWSTRGWTYQEGILSTRRIVLTPHQAYFECNGMHTYESMHLPVEFLQTPNKQQYMPFVRAGIFTGMPQDSYGMTGTRMQLLSDGRLQMFWRYVEEYSSRELTYASDALDAFAGILGSFRDFEWRPIVDFWGLPVYGRESDREYRQMMLGFSLAWRFKNDQNQPIQRRENFPSWSWIGWRGVLFARSMDYLHDNTMLDSVIGVDLRLQLKTLEGSWLDVEEVADVDMPNLNSRFLPIVKLVDAPTLLLHQLLSEPEDARVSSFDKNVGLLNFTAELTSDGNVVKIKCHLDIRPLKNSPSWSEIISRLHAEKWVCIIIADTYWATLCILIESVDDEYWSRIGFFEVARERNDGRLLKALKKADLLGSPRTICMR